MMFKICLLLFASVVLASGYSVDLDLEAKKQIDGRIVGGFPIDIKRVPWQVSLQGRGANHFCGASIIGSQWLLTAAHCTYSVVNAKKIVVRIGSSEHAQGGSIHNIKRIVQHKQFNRRTIDYDFSLLELDEPIAFSEKIQAINLPTEQQRVQDNTTVLITGWGLTLSDEPRDKLRGAEIPIVNQQLCLNAYKKKRVNISPRMLCAGLIGKGGKDSCQGDSGGPLVSFDSSNKNPVLHGVTSFGIGCGNPRYPGVYSRVQIARKWIRDNTGI